MLAKQGILTTDEALSIEKGLIQIKQEIEDDQFVFDIAHEDIHMSVETRLIDLIGEAGKKLHTARFSLDKFFFSISSFIMCKY
jgi:argininosuccinate lyase